MTDHWDDFDFGHHGEDHHQDPAADSDVHDIPADVHHDVHEAFSAEPPEQLPAHEDLPEHEIENDHAAEAVTDDSFPPVLDVGELPEPVDGFPWIDTATLGAADHAGFTPALDPVTPDELAAYAHTSQPADWATLADSDDPATSALARWWTPDEQ